MSLHQLIERHWQNPNPLLRALLSPLSRLFAHIATQRRNAYRLGKRPQNQLPIPVIIVGNIHAGGTGKTPITASLVRALQQKGLHVGIISRGYGRTMRDIHVLHAHSTATEAGDEPLMLYRQTQAPTAVGANRYQAGMALLAQFPDLQIIIADDGLQHYALARNLEIAVFPSADIGRDLDVLPNGALREPVSRLNGVDCVVLSNSHDNASSFAILPQRVVISHDAPPSRPIWIHSRVIAHSPYRLNRPNEILSANDIAPHSRCVAMAGIARPERFFQTLAQQGFTLTECTTLPDHAPITQIPNADYVFITEKDAVKLSPDAPDNVWVLPIRAEFQPDLAEWVLSQLKSCDN